jgi:hypothetical protein
MKGFNTNGVFTKPSVHDSFLRKKCGLWEVLKAILSPYNQVLEGNS